MNTRALGELRVKLNCTKIAFVRLFLEFMESSDSAKWVWPFSVINKQYGEVEKLLFSDLQDPDADNFQNLNSSFCPQKHFW